MFEGRECGGHVGPRSSFVLWDVMVERLLASPHLRDVRVLFAGGIHDARSARNGRDARGSRLRRAAQNSASSWARPILFTEEAVSSGAISSGVSRRSASLRSHRARGDRAGSRDALHG